MWTWLPTIQVTIPGSGFSIFNVWDIPYEWWLNYIDIAQRIVDSRKPKG